MAKKKYYLLVSCLFFTFPILSGAQAAPSSGLSGRILIEVEKNGEAWFVNPNDNLRYFLGGPSEAYNIIKTIGQGIVTGDLQKIPVGLVPYNDADNDNDGLSNRLEIALGTMPDNSDSDNDGYTDYEEVVNDYDPLNSGKMAIDNDFAKKQAGKIFLQVEGRGEAWYVNPTDGKRYYLGRPADAFLAMQRFGLGITENDLDKIPIGQIALPPNVDIPAASPVTYVPPCSQCQGSDTARTVIDSAAQAIRSGDAATAKQYYIEEMARAVEYTINFLDADGRLTLANILSGATLTASDSSQKTYTSQVEFNGQKYPINFVMKKQSDDSWLLANM